VSAASRLGAGVLASLAVAWTGVARADDPRAPGAESAAAPAVAPTEHRWGIGVQVGMLDRPTGHLGIPLGHGETAPQLPIALVGRLQLGEHTAVTAGAGLPTSAMGPAAWGGFEAFVRLWADARRIASIEAYEDAGLQLGFAGPDYWARKSDEFVGYGYAFGGPVAFALRLPVGLRVSWLRDRFDTFVSGGEILALTPSVEGLFELSAGARFRF
jgi:hypothetical protein